MFDIYLKTIIFYASNKKGDINMFNLFQKRNVKVQINEIRVSSYEQEVPSELIIKMSNGEELEMKPKDVKIKNLSDDFVFLKNSTYENILEAIQNEEKSFFQIIKKLQ